MISLRQLILTNIREKRVSQMECCRFLLQSCLVWSFLFLGTHQLQSSQTQVLLQLRQHLEYPSQLEIWQNHSVDFCSLPWTPGVNMSCQDNFVTELRILGDKPSEGDNFVGFAIPNQTLSDSFSMDSFIATFARLTSLRVLSLVSLGIWGRLPDKIDRLSSLEYLDLSSNYLFGSVPPKISTMVKLQTLIFNDNFFNDTVPDWLASLTNLRVLCLKRNQLKGPFPSSIPRISTLTDLILSGNMISGRVPSLDVSSNLNVIDLSSNKLDSSLPSMPKGLVKAYLGNNSFSGEIPHEYSKLTQLQHLDMSFNELRGTPPASLFSLPNISYLNLASNVLTGSIASHLSCGGKLSFVDISNNKLTGGLPYCLHSQADKRTVKFGGNCLSIDLDHQHAESSCVNVPEKGKHRGINLGILVGVIVCIVFVVVLLAFGFLVVCRSYCPRAISEQHLLHQAVVQDNSATGFSSEVLSSARYISEAAKLDFQLPPCRSFTLEELKEATKKFDNSAFLGEGSYGKLFKGRLENGIQVAIRCLPSSRKYSIRNLKLRLDLLAKLRHPHLVCLLGHCIDVGQNDYRVNNVFLVYEYVSSGNFRSCLSADSPEKVLNWSERLAVLIGVAKAIHFLHTGVIPGFFHNRLKANNILLNEHGVAKLSDYGLSIVSEETANSRDNEEGRKSWQMGRLEDDVYSFGSILLESIVAPSVSAKSDRLALDKLASCNSQNGLEKLNPIVLATSSQESLSTVISITNKCIAIESWSRPSFEDILWNLQYAAQVQENAAGEQRFDEEPLR